MCIRDRNQNVLDVNNKEYDYQMGVHYMDIIGECEKLGDYVVNVVEASSLSLIHISLPMYIVFRLQISRKFSALRMGIGYFPSFSL